MFLKKSSADEFGNEAALVHVELLKFTAWFSIYEERLSSA